MPPPLGTRLYRDHLKYIDCTEAEKAAYSAKLNVLRKDLSQRGFYVSRECRLSIHENNVRVNRILLAAFALVVLALSVISFMFAYSNRQRRRLAKANDLIKTMNRKLSKVNELLPPEARLSARNDGSLNTELRILAVIRLGITKSPEIAEVLNCAIRTVYKYRITLRSLALCDKDIFEEKIRKIDI